MTAKRLDEGLDTPCGRRYAVGYVECAEPISMKTSVIVLASTVLFGAARPLGAQGGQHYAGGSFNIRDFLVPGPGSYASWYSYFYRSSQFNGQNGDKLSSFLVPTNSGQSVPVNLNVDVFMTVQTPFYMWVAPWKILGGKYSVYVAPEFSNTNLNVAATTARNVGGAVGVGSFGMGDPQLQPIWLGWTTHHWDFALGDGVYVPIGKYSTQTLTGPGGNSITIASPDNIGLGFWENQVQGAGAWYPDTTHATAVVAALTWEIAGEKRDLNYTPGQQLTLNWGFSQYLPLPRSQILLWELGIAGYDSWQVTKTTGAGFTGPNTLNSVNAVGGELDLTNPQAVLTLTVHGFYEYSAVSRLRGPSFGISLGGKL